MRQKGSRKILRDVMWRFFLMPASICGAILCSANEILSVECFSIALMYIWYLVLKFIEQ